MTASSPRPERSPLRLGVLGAGLHSQYCHGPALRAVAAARGSVQLAAVCDLDGERARNYAGAFGFARAYTDLDAMLASEALDGLVAVTPVALTLALAARLLPRGIPLLLEKPPGRSAGETAQLLALAEAAGTPHMVSFNRRFNPALLRAAAWLHKAGRPPKTALARMLRIDRRETTFVTETGIHLVDAVNGLLGTPVHVDAASTGEPDARFTRAVVSYASGCAAHLFFSPAAGTGEETYEVHGDDYTLLADTVRGTLAVWERGEPVMQWSAPGDAIDAYRDGTVHEMEAFCDALAGRRVFAPTLRDGLLSMRTVEAVAQGGAHDITPTEGVAFR